jgi:hypothetical protein
MNDTKEFEISGQRIIRRPLKLEFGGVRAPLGLKDGSSQLLPFPSVELLIDCIKNKHVESLCFKGRLPVPEDSEDNVGLMVALLKTAKFHGASLQCLDLPKGEKHVWDSARTHCGIDFKEEDAKLKAEEEARIERCKEEEKDRNGDEDHENNPNVCSSFAICDFDCYLTGLTFFGPLLLYRHHWGLGETSSRNLLGVVKVVCQRERKARQSVDPAGYHALHQHRLQSLPLRCKADNRYREVWGPLHPRHWRIHHLLQEMMGQQRFWPQHQRHWRIHHHVLQEMMRQQRIRPQHLRRLWRWT